jgi:membrane protease YdiL (CAAX protease family)
MSADHIPPRPDGLHPLPVPAMPAAAATGGLAARPTSTWKLWEAIGIYLLAIVIAAFATLPILELVHDEDLATLAASAVAALVIIGVLLVWLRRRHPTFPKVLGFPAAGEWWREIRASVGFGLLLYPGIVFGVGLIVNLLLSAVSGKTVQTPEQVPGGLPPIGVAITILYAIVIAPIHEELFFRGILFRAARDRYGLLIGLLVSGLGFGLIHYLEGPWQNAALLMGVMFFNGIALAWWYERRGTIVASVVAHMVFNVIGLTLIFLIG